MKTKGIESREMEIERGERKGDRETTERRKEDGEREEKGRQRVKIKGIER